MKPAVQYWIELTGTALVLMWVFRYPDAFGRMTQALSGAAVGSVRSLQGRG